MHQDPPPAPSPGGSPPPGWQPSPGGYQAPGWQPSPAGDPPPGWQPAPGEFPTRGEHPPARRRRRRWGPGAVLLVVVLAAAGLVAGGGTARLLDLVADRRAGPSATPTDDPSGVVDLSPFYETLNTALAARDRDLFFSRVTGAAVEPLSLWWDNMDLLGWSTGAISYGSVGDLRVTGPSARIEVLLGTDMSYPQRGRDASQAIATMGFPYEATIDLSGPEPLITEWAAIISVRPWDLAPLRVVAGEGVVVAGFTDEEAFLDQLLPVAADASAWTRSDYVLQRQQAPPAAGFLIFATMDETRFSSWFRGEGSEPWVMDPAAIAVSGGLPRPGMPGLDPRLATGVWRSGGVVSIGPGGIGSDDLTARLLVHEFAHVLQSIDTPSRSESPPLATLEGWAEYQTLRFANGGAFPTSGPVAAHIGSCVSEAPTVPTDEELRGQGAQCSYAIASTLFAYAELNGVLATQLVDEAAGRGVSPFDAAQSLGSPMSDEDWAAWVLATYG